MGICFSFSRRSEHSSDRPAPSSGAYAPIPSASSYEPQIPPVPRQPPLKEEAPGKTEKISSATEISLDCSVVVVRFDVDEISGAVEVELEIDSPSQESILRTYCCCTVEIKKEEVKFLPQPGITDSIVHQEITGSDSGLPISVGSGQRVILYITIPPENLVSNDQVGYYPLGIALCGGEQSRYCLVSYVKNSPVQFSTKNIILSEGIVYLLQEVFSTSVNRECIVCMSAPSDVVLLPCRHQCVCLQCVEELLMSGKCPLCRAVVKESLSAGKLTEGG